MKQCFISIFILFFSGTVWAKDTGTYLKTDHKISDKNRPAAAAIYKKYKQPFLSQINKSTSKILLINEVGVQVLHGFKTTEAAQAYLKSELFKQDVVRELKPYLDAPPEISIFQAM